MRFNVSLLEAITMLLPLDVFTFHVFALQALILPVKLEVDVASDRCDRQILTSQFHNFLLDLLVFNALQIGVHLKVLGHDLVSQLRQRLDLIRRERL